MQIQIVWNTRVTVKFPELAICVGIINGVRNEKDNIHIQELKKTVYSEVKSKYNVETLKVDPVLQAYRDFYWKLGIDPTKTRPSGEALLRRVLRGDAVPRISTVVDAYNLASMQSIIPISGFDKDRLASPFQVRFAKNGENFTGIGMEKPLSLTEKMLVLADGKQVLCIYPYRDAEATKITEQTKNVLVVGYGAPGITAERLKGAVETTLSYIKLASGGEIATVKVFSASPK
ncbi:MAG: phenylalanine--tRNA ligase beta subunit-related protein [Candidatus Bathyarchaeia archaeon]